MEIHTAMNINARDQKTGFRKHQSTASVIMSEAPDLSAVFRVLADLIKNGVISQYAVGDAVGAIFYVEPRETFDLDIFFVLAHEPSSPLLRVEAIYEYARSKGFETSAEFIRIHGWAVQFLESSTPLWKEAVSEAREVEFEGAMVRVMGPEYLAAMMVGTGRSKDWIRLADFLEADILNSNEFESIINKHGLTEKWDAEKWRFTRQ